MRAIVDCVRIGAPKDGSEIETQAGAQQRTGYEWDELIGWDRVMIPEVYNSFDVYDITPEELTEKFKTYGEMYVFPEELESYNIQYNLAIDILILDKTVDDAMDDIADEFLSHDNARYATPTFHPVGMQSIIFNFEDSVAKRIQLNLLRSNDNDGDYVSFPNAPLNLKRKWTFDENYQPKYTNSYVLEKFGPDVEVWSPDKKTHMRKRIFIDWRRLGQARAAANERALRRAQRRPDYDWNARAQQLDDDWWNDNPLGATPPQKY